MKISIYRAGGRPRADQPLFVDCAQLLAEIDWNPEIELLEEAIEIAGFGMLRWVEQSGGTFYEFDENGDVELIAEVEQNDENSTSVCRRPIYRGKPGGR